MKNDLEYIVYPVVIVSTCGEVIAVATCLENIIIALLEHWDHHENDRNDVEIVGCEWYGGTMSGSIRFNNIGFDEVCIKTVGIYDQQH